MGTQGKISSRFRKALETVRSFGMQSRSPSATSNGEEYQRLINSDDGMSKEELQMSTRLTRSSKRVPKGHLPVYVGHEKKRFVIRIDYMSHPLFKPLFEQNTLGVERVGGLQIDFEPDLFEQMLKAVESEHKERKQSPFKNFKRFFSN
ncbi:unnamed protein product [Calypogeia fissa]